jgi:hypothetical protein
MASFAASVFLRASLENQYLQPLSYHQITKLDERDRYSQNWIKTKSHQPESDRGESLELQAMLE